MGKPFRLRCASVPYRRGEFEVIAGIHDGLVNIEAWAIASELPLHQGDQIDTKLTDDAYDGNVEIELTPDEARQLAAAILEAANASEPIVRS